ncbi:DUF7424 family protein [Agrobacterium larrymoorei]|uniref:DUF7424 domain-containing protein n=1 Tax=Agrobacterium larrymoorei TaxID=160699 RepID=A0AAF0HBW6_9HYPH|nr:hypothetical protein [Agrobacterium larrymoorei]WHA43223.1 hypothetical protein CFBP5477_018415 [Agrobacterium larrymoorei]
MGMERVRGNSVIRKLSGVCLMAVALASCEQKLSATLYLRDIQQMMTSNQHDETPVDIKIDILETGMENQCDRPSGREIVDLVGSYFEKATLLGCEKIAGSMNGRMSIKVTTRLSYTEQAEAPVKYLLEFQAGPRPNEVSDPLFIRFDPEKYADLQAKVKRLNAMTSIKLSEARIALTINNDLREDAPLTIYSGAYVDGQPMEFQQNRILKPREETLIEFGNVKSAFLGQYGWGYILGWKHENQQSQSN